MAVFCRQLPHTFGLKISPPARLWQVVSPVPAENLASMAFPREPTERWLNISARRPASQQPSPQQGTADQRQGCEPSAASRSPAACVSSRTNLLNYIMYWYHRRIRYLL